MVLVAFQIFRLEAFLSKNNDIRHFFTYDSGMKMSWERHLDVLPWFLVRSRQDG